MSLEARTPGRSAPEFPAAEQTTVIELWRGRDPALVLADFRTKRVGKNRGPTFVRC